MDLSVNTRTTERRQTCNTKLPTGTIFPSPNLFQCGTVSLKTHFDNRYSTNYFQIQQTYSTAA